MKKIIATILNVVSTLLTGIAFGLGSLTVMYQFEKTGAMSKNSNALGNFYERVWINSESHMGVIILFFVLVVAALAVTASLLMNKKKGMIVALVSALLLLASGVGMLMFTKLYVMGTSIATPFVLGEGAISMGVLLLIAGVFQGIKTALLVKVED